MPFLGTTPTQGFVGANPKQSFTANGSTTVFTLTNPVASANDLEVFVGNVRQEPTAAYSAAGTTLTMTEAPDAGLNFYVINKSQAQVTTTLGANSVSTSQIIDSNVTNAKLAGSIPDSKIAALAASKLTGALPALNGSALTDLIGSLSYNGGTTLGNLRIQTGSVQTPSSTTDAGTSEGTSARYYNITSITLTGFASVPTAFGHVRTNYHEAVCGTVSALTTTNLSFMTRVARAAGIQNVPLYYIAIGQAS